MWNADARVQREALAVGAQLAAAELAASGGTAAEALGVGASLRPERGAALDRGGGEGCEQGWFVARVVEGFVCVLGG